ncbi:hypothetical protein ESCO_006226 [Escovopsis weberi]|uniref:ORP1 n=1 Tax=Escovopsis weberi TaxID=150374 RepID=A0A0M8N432_ESCWE|nr:hypothetical protein ESCO_006226 [Escovopsis weberi]
MPDDQWEEPCCMFVKDCNTGSQLRKAISHLFGRNKSCTLRIPKKIWVYYCRKHYQRVRYRNAKTYPLNQMELVKLQIRRLRTWSVDNQRGGSGPFIKSWTLSLRKREKNRLNQNPSGANAGADAADDGEGQAPPAAPEWLLQRLGSGYTTEQMMEIADSLHEAIRDGSLSQVPEIEFLPDIKDPDEEDGSVTRPFLTRKQSRPSIDARPPKRKASIFSNVHAEIHPPSPYWREQQMASRLQEKRARINKMASPYRREPVDIPGPSSGVGVGLGVQFLHQEQDQGHGGHGVPIHDRTGASTGAYSHGQQGPSDRRFGPKPPQPAWEWEPHRTGHFRLPSISAQLPPEPQALANVSIPPAHAFHRGLEAGPGDEDRPHMMHQQRSSATLPPPWGDA